MNAVNLLDHPIILTQPAWVAPSPWAAHLPLTLLLLDLTRPRLLVELGVGAGLSYCALLQAAATLGADTNCLGVCDPTEESAGDVAGALALRAYHDTHYAASSSLLHETPDRALGAVADGSVDLLHLNGSGGPGDEAATRRALDLWLPKLSARGVVIAHGATERLGSDLLARFPRRLAVTFGGGMAALAVESEAPDGLRALIAAQAEPGWPLLSATLERLGAGVVAQARLALLEREAERERARHAALTGRYGRQGQRLAALERERLRLIEERAALRRAHETALAEADRSHAENQARLDNALWQLNTLDASPGVRAIKLARAARQMLRRQGPLALTRRAALWATGKRGAFREERALAQATPKAPRPAHERKQIIFISGCPGGPMRYRCEHRAEQLNLLGCSAEAVAVDTVDLMPLLDRFECFVLHRAPMTDELRAFIAGAHAQGKPVIFETDDLIFDPEATHLLAELTTLGPQERAAFVDEIARNRQTLLATDAATVSTAELARRVTPLRERVSALPNVVSHEMAQRSEAALAARERLRAEAGTGAGEVVIGYVSGSPSHDRDFLQAEASLLWALETYPQTRLLVMGPLRLSAAFARFGARVERAAFRPWQRLPEVYARLDINLAPLEPDNPFTEAKSCVKYLEAGLVKIPTVASPREDFRRVIRTGENGLLAETPDEWRAALEWLITSPTERATLGERAYADIHARHTTRAQAPEAVATLRALYRDIRREPGREQGRQGAHDERALRVTWVAQAPTAELGALRGAFSLAKALAERGHALSVSVHRAPDQVGLSDGQMRALLEKHLGPLGVAARFGADLPPAEVTVAATWRVAAHVAEHHESRVRLALSDHFAPDMFAPFSAEYEAAERALRLPLRQVCLGGALAAHVSRLTGVPALRLPIPVDGDIFHMARPLEERAGPPRLLLHLARRLPFSAREAALEAVERTLERRPDLMVEAFSDGEEAALAADADETLDEGGDAEGAWLPAGVSDLGRLSALEQAKAMNWSHLLLTLDPSDTPQVALRGMACGLATVALADGALLALGEQGAPCRLVAPTADALTEALLALSEDTGARADLGRRAAETQASITWQTTAASLERLLLEERW